VSGSFTLSDPPVVQAIAISWFNPDSYTIKKTYDDTVTGRDYAPKSPGSMQPNEVPRGNTIGAHPDNLDAIHARPRTKVFEDGRVAELRPSSVQGSWLQINDTERRGMRLDTDQSILVIRLGLIPLHVSTLNLNTEEEIVENAERATWEFRARLRGYENGSSSPVTYATETDYLQDNSSRGFKHPPTSPNASKFDLLRRGFFKEVDISSSFERHFREDVVYHDNNLPQQLPTPEPITMDLDSLDGVNRRREVPLFLDIDARLDGIDDNSNSASDFVLYIHGMHVEEQSGVGAT